MKTETPDVGFLALPIGGAPIQLPMFEGGADGAAGGAGGAAGAGTGGADGGNNDDPTNARAGRSDADADADVGDVDDSDDEQDDEADPNETEEERRAREAGRELAGRKKTLRADVIKERKGRQAAETERDQLRRQLEAFESWTPIIERLANRPDLQQAVIDGRLTITQAERQQERDNDTELREIAEDLGFVKETADGQRVLDLDRAKRYRDRHQRWSRDAAGETVKPFADMTTSQQAEARIARVVDYATKEGIADPAFVRAEFEKIARNPNTLKQLLDDAGGNALYEMVVGKAVRLGKTGKGRQARRAEDDGGGGAGERREVDGVITEPAGGGKGPKLTPAERALGAQYGLTDKDWALGEQVAGLKKGYTALE